MKWLVFAGLSLPRTPRDRSSSRADIRGFDTRGLGARSAAERRGLRPDPGAPHRRRRPRGLRALRGSRRLPGRGRSGGAHDDGRATRLERGESTAMGKYREGTRRIDSDGSRRGQERMESTATREVAERGTWRVYSEWKASRDGTNTALPRPLAAGRALTSRRRSPSRVRRGDPSVMMHRPGRAARGAGGRGLNDRASWTTAPRRPSRRRARRCRSRAGTTRA